VLSSGHNAADETTTTAYEKYPDESHLHAPKLNFLCHFVDEL